MYFDLVTAVLAYHILFCTSIFVSFNDASWTLFHHQCKELTRSLKVG